ncbi:uncharacterized protein TM35_000292050 [Trypanosoma theileri]|uniref:Uncharacterized protein n=1 Tax=Trypanosoma theileri TaxID=67003 RepID=A0A1X0NPB2_9TRYP|nr:uncharacterized protein TM35_000292050 [Trypanosoma theileri]ORC86323.1 hypothetical protein TM35_000292050 [Trypanosoma theileri]
MQSKLKQFALLGGGGGGGAECFFCYSTAVCMKGSSPLLRFNDGLSNALHLRAPGKSRTVCIIRILLVKLSPHLNMLCRHSFITNNVFPLQKNIPFVVIKWARICWHGENFPAFDRSPIGLATIPSNN